MANVFQRTVTFEDATATPPSQATADFVIAMNFGDAETVPLPAVPVGATDVKISTIVLSGEDVAVSASALADLNL